MGRNALNAEWARHPLVQWQAARPFLNKCRGCTTSRQARPVSLCHGPQASGLRLEREVEGKARTRVSSGPLLIPGSSSFRVPVGVQTYLEAPDLLGCVVSPCHVAPFGLPMQWGEVSFPVWLGDVA
jgi:hypothetical protein